VTIETSERNCGRRRNKTKMSVGGKKNNWGEELKDTIIGDDEL
jgi:hypothetical protein